MSSSEGLLGAYSKQLEVDILLYDLYHYYQCGGIFTIIAVEISKIVAVIFTVLLTSTLIFIPWEAFFKCDDPTSCLPLEKLIQDGFTLLIGQYNGYIQLYFGIIFSAIVMQLCHSISKIWSAWKLKFFYEQQLHLSSVDFEIMTWSDVMKAIMQAQEQCDILGLSHRSLTELEIIQRIMRKDNYLIAMLNANVINLALPQWACFSSQRKPLLNSLFNKWIEKVLYSCFLDHLFLSNGRLNQAFLNNTASIAFRLRILGLFNCLFGPLLSLCVGYVFCLENFQRFYSNREHLNERAWKSVFLWQVREFNELPHILERRIKLCYIPAELYIQGYSNRIIGAAAKCIGYMSGCFVTLLVVVSFIDEDILLYTHLFGHNLLWLIGSLSIIYAVARSCSPDYKVRHYNPTALMRQIVACLHQVPPQWIQLAETNRIRVEVAELFPLKIVLFFFEILIILVSPLLLYYSIPDSIQQMAAFVKRTTISTEEMGDICSLSASISVTDPFEYSSALVNKVEQSRKSFVLEYGAALGNNDTMDNELVGHSFAQDGISASETKEHDAWIF